MHASRAVTDRKVLTLLATLMLSAGGAHAEPADWEIDPAHFSIAFGVEHTGSLTTLGDTHPVELDVTINQHADYPFGHGRETLGISAHTTIQRSRWGMDYGVADDLVGDEITLRFEFEALRE